MFKSSKRLISMLICLALVLACLPMAVFAADTVTVFFYNTNNWGSPNVYWWGGTDAPAWPGIAMTDVGDGYWSAEVPTDLTGIIFNGTGGQTGDLTLPTDLSNNCYAAGSWAPYTGGAIEIPMATVYVDAAACGYATVNAYFWGGTSTTTWPGTAMTLVDGDIYSIEVSADTTSIIFNDGSAQTDDLAFPGDGYIWNGTEFVDYATYVPGGEVVDPEPTDPTDPSLPEEGTNPSEPEAPAVYYLVGSMTEWTFLEDYILADNGDGTYSITIPLTAGSHEYKAATDDWSSEWPMGGNQSVYLTADGDVTFVLNTTDNTLTATGDTVGEAPKEPIVVESITAVGNGDGNWLNGAAWDPTATLNVLTNDGTGVYTIGYYGVAAGTYEFKFAADGSWERSWGTGAEVISGEVYDAYFNGNNCVLNLANDADYVELTLDLSNCDTTGAGAKISVYVEEPVVCPVVDNAPETVVDGDNAFAVAQGSAGVAGTYTATATGTLIINPTTMSMWDEYEGALVETRPMMMFGRNFYVTVNGEAVYGAPATIDVVAGETYAIGVKSNMGTAAEITLNVSVVDYTVKFQGKDNGDGTYSIRLLAPVADLSAYTSVSFDGSIGGTYFTSPLVCTNAFVSVLAGSNKVTASQIFDGANYLVMYTIDGITAEYAEQDLSVSVIWTSVEGYDEYGYTRTINIGDLLGI